MNKKKMLFLLPLIGAMSLAGCKKKEEAACSHADENSDFVCDLCGATLATTAVELDTSKVQKLFSLGEAFNAEGLKVIATSELGGTKELAFTTSTPDMSTVGDKTVVVTYGQGENDKKSYSINVSFWSEDDLDVLAVATLAGAEGGVALPYLPGYGMKVDAEIEEDELLDWHIVAYGVTEEAFLELYQSYLGFKPVVEVDGDDVTFCFYPVAVKNAEGFHGLTHVQVLRMSPTFEPSEGMFMRYYEADQYFIMGFNAQNELIIEAREINTMLEGLGFASADEICDGTSGYPVKFLSELAEPIEKYLSEIAADEFKALLPTDTTTSTLFGPTNIKSCYPLAESLDKYELAWDVAFTGYTAAKKDSFIEQLTAAGFEAVTEDEVTSYVKSSDYIGTMEYIPYYDTEHSFFGFEFYYKTSEKYEFVSRMHPMIVSLMEDVLGVTRYELDTDFYSSSNEEVDAWYKINAPEAVPASGTEGEPGYVPAQSSEEVAMSGVVTALTGVGFIVMEAPEATKYYGKVDCWKAKLTLTGYFDIVVYTFAPEKGEVEICLEISKFYSFSIEDVVGFVFGSETPVQSGDKYSATIEGTTEGYATILDIAMGMLDIVNIDGDLYQKKTGEQFFSGLTKDGKYVFTVTVSTNAEEASEVDVVLQIEELGKKEELMRDTLNRFSSSGPIRHVSYEINEDGSINTEMYFNIALDPALIIDDIEKNVLPEGFAKVSGEAAPVVYSNGSITYTIAFSEYTPDGSSTTYLCVEVTIADVPAQA